MQADKSQPYVIPPPVGGWNARDALPVMDSQDALILDNVFPETNLCRVIGGGKVIDSVTIAGGAFETFAEYFPGSGSSYGIVVDGSFFRVVTSSGTFTGSTYASGGIRRWQSVNMGGSIIFVCGSAAPVAYNGTTWSAPTYTGTSLDPTKLGHVDTYKSRLYFVQDNSLNIWYGGVKAISGALTAYDITGIVRRGGSILYAGSVTKDTFGGVADLFVIVTDQGEVIFFTGDNPASGWAIAGRGYIGVPLGKRAFCPVQADLLVATTEGIVSLNKMIDAGYDADMLTTKIQNAYNAAATAVTSYDGWELKYWPAGHMLILNVPQSYPNDIHQYVMNTFTGAWCRFKGIQASALCPLGNKLFYGVKGAVDNQIVQFGQDPKPPADIEIQSAYLPLSDSTSIKQVKRIRPFFNSNKGFGYFLECPVDFETKIYSNLVRSTNNIDTAWGSAWGSSWSSGNQTNPAYYSVDCRTGTFFSYKLKTNQTGGSNFVAPTGTTLSAVSFIFEEGGIL